MLLPGQVLDDRYRLDHRLATGGMGDVWRATDLVLGRPVAVKVLLPALLADPDFTTRFQAEARMIATLRHPGVVQVYDYGQTTVPSGDVAYLVMAYVDGEPLSRLLTSAGWLPVAETLTIVAQAADALQAVHDAGIVHRDVKPANLLVQQDGTVVLVDFGVAQSVSATRLTGAGTIVGTALYMAPEQISGQPVSAATDVYALGALTFHCLAGRPPFEGDNALQVAFHQVHDEPPPLPDDVPAAVQALVRRALAKRPADRYPDAAAFAQVARAALADAGPDARTELVGAAPVADTGPATLSDLPAAADQPKPAGGRRGRRAVLLAAAVVVPLLLVLAAAAALMRQSADRHDTPPPAQPKSSSRPAAPTTTAPAKNAGTNEPSTVPTRTTGPTSANTTAPAPTSVPTTVAPTPTTNPGGGGSPVPTPTATAHPVPTTAAPALQDRSLDSTQNANPSSGNAFSAPRPSAR